MTAINFLSLHTNSPSSDGKNWAYTRLWSTSVLYPVTSFSGLVRTWPWVERMNRGFTDRALSSWLRQVPGYNLPLSVLSLPGASMYSVDREPPVYSLLDQKLSTESMSASDTSNTRPDGGSGSFLKNSGRRSSLPVSPAASLNFLSHVNTEIPRFVR